MTKVKRLSKRIKIHRRNNIAKKVREHKRKMKKEARKAVKTGLVSNKLFRQKISGPEKTIPNNWPLKAEELMEIKEKRIAKAMENEEKRKLRNQGVLNPEVEIAKRKRGQVSETEVKDLFTLRREAEERQQAFERMNSTAFLLEKCVLKSNTIGGSEAQNTRRRFYRDLRKVIDMADVVIQVLDARDPMSCRCPALEKEIFESPAGGTSSSPIRL